MGLKFKTLCIILAVFCAVFTVLFFGFPSAYVATYDVSPTPSSDFMAKRSAPILLGLGVLVWLLRDTQDVAVQKAVCYGAATIFFGIAVTGTLSYVQGIAGGMILLAALSEVAVGAYLFAFGRSR